MSSSSSKGSSKVYLVLGGVALAAVAAGAGYYMLSNKTPNKTQNEPKTVTTPSEPVEQQPAKITEVPSTVETEIIEEPIKPISQTSEVSVSIEEEQSSTNAVAELSPGGEDISSSTISTVTTTVSEIDRSISPPSVPTPKDEEVEAEDGWKIYTNEKLGLVIKSPGAMLGGSEKTYIISFNTEASTTLMVEPFVHSSLDEFVRDSFKGIEEGMNAHIDIISQKPASVSGYEAVEMEYKIIFDTASDDLPNQTCWAMVVAANGLIYMLQQSSTSPTLVLDTAKKIAESIIITDARSAGSTRVRLANGLEVKLPSVFFSPSKRMPEGVSLDYSLKNSVQQPIRGYRVYEYGNVASLEELVEKHKKVILPSGYSQGDNIKLRRLSMETKSYTYSDATYEYVDVPFVADEEGFVVTIYYKPEEKSKYLITALDTFAETQKHTPEGEIKLIYENLEYFFYLQAPYNSTVRELLHADPVVSITTTVKCEKEVDVETNVACITVPPGSNYDNLETLMEQVKRELLTTESEFYHNIIQECKTTIINGLPAVEIVYEQEILFSPDNLKWLLHAIPYQNKIYYVRSNIYREVWFDEVDQTVREIHNTLQIYKFV